MTSNNIYKQIQQLEMEIKSDTTHITKLEQKLKQKLRDAHKLREQLHINLTSRKLGEDAVRDGGRLN